VSAREPRRRRRVLVLAPGELGERLIGPEIRALEFAKALSGHQYEVTLAAQRSCDGERDGIPVLAASRRRLMREAMRHDAVLSACLPPYLLAQRSLHPFTAIADLYDPHEQELATLQAGRERERKLRAHAAIQALQLRHADIVLCASERQRAELQRSARALLGSEARLPDPAVVPFGIPDPPAPSGRRPLHERFPQLADEDTLVLWWGSVWRWLDAETPVRAFARIASQRSDLKLVITAGSPPNQNAGRHFDATEEIRALAEELGVLGRTVLFFDEWIPYEQRHDYLREADIGLTLHRHAAEARLAARARYMDYLSAELPCVLGRGDETAEELGAGGFATLLEDPDPEVLAAALLALADNPDALAGARAAGHELAAERHWSAVGAKLRAALADGAPLPPAHRGSRGTAESLALLGGAGAYYARVVVDRLSATS
jgi:glycosyltransferase involved in cell wall biosynthesis